MAAFAHLSREERVGLGIAVAAHVALVAALVFQPSHRDAVPTPDRMSVSLADEVSLESTAPDPTAQPQAAVAPVLAPEPEPVIEQPPEVVERPAPKPVPRTPPSSQPKPRPQPTQAAKPKPKPATGSRIGADFLPGAAAGTASDNPGNPGATFGAAERASLEQAINRQLKPFWSAPSGPDSDKLVTILAFNLNEDGSLAGTPRVVRQEGITPTNEAQASRHAEQAIRAVRLAAPFDLPPQFYDKWKRISAWRFDRRL